MKESEFIEQNKKKWLDFENNLLKKDADPSVTSKLFVQITDDLSYARTFYQNRSVRLYLNGVARLLFNDLNKTSKKAGSGFLNFWKKDLPLTVYQARRAMLISFLVFVACFTLGVLTSMHDKDFARAILSSSYVNMTDENIAKGDAMAVYKSDSELRTFLPILYNNLKVDFLTFFSGIFMAIGSLVIMVSNGVMVGVFQYYFIERGLFWDSFLTIWTHGTLEISTIILSGGAGLTLGKGLLFPGTHTRFQAFKLSGMNGLKIIMGVAPITFLAAFIEGFLTRHTSIPDVLRFAFILLSFGFILLYFFFYPRRVARQHANKGEGTDHNLVYRPPVKFDPAEIYPTIKIITETFRQLFAGFLFFGKYIFAGALACAILTAINPLDLFHARDNFTFEAVDFFNYSEFPFLGILHGLCMIALALAFLGYLKKKLVPGESSGSFLHTPKLARTAFTLLLTTALFVFIIFTGASYTLIAAHILFPLLTLVVCVSCYQNSTFYDSVGYAGSLITQSWSRFLLSGIVFFLLSLVIYNAAIYGFRALLIKDALIWMLTDDEVVAEKISFGFVVFQTAMSFFLYLCLSFISGSLLFFTLKEAYTAGHLIARIKSIAPVK